MRSSVARTRFLLTAFLAAGIVLTPAVAAPVADDPAAQQSAPAASAPQPSSPQQPSAQPQSPTAPGQGVRLLVKFRNEGTAPATLRAVGANELRTIGDIGVHVVTVPSDRAAAALGALSSNSTVAWAERDGLLQPQEMLPNDPYFLNSSAWNISGGAWGWYQTHTTQAWDITQGEPSVVVAVLDTGIKTNGLTDFDGQIAATWNAMNGTTDATTNAGNHGTYTAGVIGLALGNGVGNAGLCPRCKLMVVQVGTDSVPG